MMTLPPPSSAGGSEPVTTVVDADSVLLRPNGFSQKASSSFDGLPFFSYLHIIYNEVLLFVLRFQFGVSKALRLPCSFRTSLPRYPSLLFLSYFNRMYHYTTASPRPIRIETEWAQLSCINILYLYLGGIFAQCGGAWIRLRIGIGIGIDWALLRTGITPVKYPFLPCFTC